MRPLHRLLAALALVPLLACAEHEPPRAIFLLVVDTLRAAADRDARVRGDGAPSPRDREALRALGSVEPASPE